MAWLQGSTNPKKIFLIANVSGTLPRQRNFDPRYAAVFLFSVVVVIVFLALSWPSIIEH